MAKSKAGTEMNCVDLMLYHRKKPTAIDKHCFVGTILRNKFSRFARSMRGGQAGYDAGSSFLMDFNLLSHLKLSSRLKIVTYNLYSIVYRRLGFNCEYLLIANCEFFYVSQLIDLPTLSASYLQECI